MSWSFFLAVVLVVVKSALGKSSPLTLLDGLVQNQELGGCDVMKVAVSHCVMCCCVLLCSGTESTKVNCSILACCNVYQHFLLVFIHVVSDAS